MTVYKRWTISIFWAAAILILGDAFLPSHAGTASVSITDGYLAISISSYPKAEFNLIGEGFEHKGGGGDQGRVTGCAPCRPGMVHSLNAYFSGASIAGTMRRGASVYTVPISADRMGILSFRALVAIPSEFSSSAVVTAPFVFDGWIMPNGCCSAGPQAVRVSGRGTVTEELTGYFADPHTFVYQTKTVRFTFSPESQ